MTEKKMLVIDLCTTGLHPLKDFMTGVACKSADEERVITNENESELINELVRYIKDNNFEEVYGFNSAKFDVPFLRIRCLKHGISLKDLNVEFIDLRAVLSGNVDRMQGTLSDYKKLLNIAGQCNKIDIRIAWKSGNIQPYKEVILDDVRTTWCLLERTKEVGLL
jgi:uncharacterized protein YprB with RNaseH-like and TPR domain